MAAYDGVPSVRLEGDPTRALSLLPEGKALLFRAQQVRERMGVSTFAMARRVDDDSSIYVLSAMGQNIIQISSQVHAPEELEETTEASSSEGLVDPTFYSGLVFGGLLEQRTRTLPDGATLRYGVCVSFAPTEMCRGLFPRELVAGRQEVERLAVVPWVAFDELTNKSGFGPVFTQYTRLRASMYSGMMRRAVQVVMGMGKLPKEAFRSPTEKVEDSEYIKDSDKNGVRVRYDWRFFRTHGITRAADGRPWLIEISVNRGVLARPLPIFPQSDQIAYRYSAQARRDTPMAIALEELGCLPTGEAFPNTSALIEGLVESGEILRLLPPDGLAEFYKCSPYSSAMGWAFNDAGSEAHNTGYYFGDDGFQRGVWYQLNISIGPTNQRWTPGTPLASGTAVLRKQAEGFIYCPPARQGSYARYVPMKFHEPLLPGLLSHEGVPSIEAHGLPVPRVDTPMFVCFVDNALKVVRYFRDPNQRVVTEVDDPRFPGECLLAGSWTITERSGTQSFPTMMYSNDFDDRERLDESVKVTEITSRDLGYDPPKFSDFIESPETAYVWRERIFRRTTVTEIRDGERVVSAVAVPQFCREAYYYATGKDYERGRRGTTSITFDVVRDPNVGYAWRCFPRINAPPFPPNRPDCNTRVCRGDAPCSSGGIGFPKERRIVCLAYEPGSGGPWVSGGGGGAACHEFADQGEWLSICQIVDTFNNPGMDKTSTTTSWDALDDGVGRLFLVTNGHGGPIQIPVTASQVFNHWMTPSPEPTFGTIQFIRATYSTMGVEGVVYTTNLSTYQGEVRTFGFVPDPVHPQNDGIPAFIGVNVP